MITTSNPGVDFLGKGGDRGLWFEGIGPGRLSPPNGNRGLRALCVGSTKKS